MQFVPAARLAPQLLVSEKSPLAEIDEMVTGNEPVLESVMICAALVVATLVPANVRLAGESEAAGNAADPLRLRERVPSTESET